MIYYSRAETSQQGGAENPVETLGTSMSGGRPLLSTTRASCTWLKVSVSAADEIVRYEHTHNACAATTTGQDARLSTPIRPSLRGSERSAVLTKLVSAGQRMLNGLAQSERHAVHNEARVRKAEQQRVSEV